MRRDPRAFLLDVRTAADSIAAFVLGRTIEEFTRDALVHSAVERQLEKAGQGDRNRPGTGRGPVGGLGAGLRAIAAERSGRLVASRLVQRLQLPQLRPPRPALFVLPRMLAPRMERAA